MEICYLANAAVHAWAHYSPFHHYTHLILKTASAASAQDSCHELPRVERIKSTLSSGAFAILDLSSACAPWAGSSWRCFFIVLCVFSRKSKLIILDRFDLPVLPVFLWPHSSPHNCLRSIMFCGVNLLTCVSSGTKSWTVSKQLSFHPLPIFPLSPINQCDVIA